MSTEETKTINEEMKLEREEIPGKKRKLNKDKIIAIFLIAVVVLAVLGFFIYNSYDISLSAYWIPRVNEVGTADAIERIETFEKEKSEKVLYVNIFKADYEAFKKKNEDYVKAEADKISEQISALKKVDKIESYEMYSEIYDHLNSIMLSDSGVLEEKIKAEVKNYDDYLSYREDFDALVETYKVECEKCGGKGGYSAVCSYCNGSGKCVVTWYSEGDWGEKSYSSYDCTRCSGGVSNRDCPSCNGGYNYIFG